MKKIILAVASVLALGMLVSCKQEISGELDVNTHSKDLTTYKYYYYKADGNVTQTTTESSVVKAAGASSAQYASGSTVTVDTYAPKNQILLKVTSDPNTNTTKYEYTIKAKKTTETTATTNNATATSAATTSTVAITHSETTAEQDISITIYKVDGKYYLDRKAQDGSEIYVTKDFNPDGDTVDLSKFSDTTTTSSDNYNGTRTPNAATTAGTVTTSNDNLFDWTSKTTTVTGGYVSTLKLTKLK